MKNHSLPLELIEEILLRLPVRSILRFKCVCKSWFSLISEPQFAVSHYDLAATPTHRLLLRSDYYFYAQSIDTDTPLNMHPTTVNLLLPPPSPPRDPGPSNFNHYYDSRFQPEILGSCRGFLLLYYITRREIILWNPSIGLHKRITDVAYRNLTNEFLFGFGYDPSTDDYLLILVSTFFITPPEVGLHVFSFKTCSWKEYYPSLSYDDCGNKCRAGSLLNGALHWLVFSRDKKRHVIIAIDLIQMILFEIPLLDSLISEKYLIDCLRVIGGCLGVCCWVQEREVTEIWVMKEYKVQSSWTKSFVIPNYDEYIHFSPICITKDGGIFGSNNGGKFLKLNKEGEWLEELLYGHYEWSYCHNLQSALYRESLLLIPGVIGETSEDDDQK
ncbi:hypothetical protein JHK87_018499 [Glycine soja]|nr:hypothetical protein JHK87_018499 [Glycine soja]